MSEPSPERPALVRAIGRHDLAAAVVNGSGYRNPPGVGGSNRSRSLDFEGRVNFSYKGFVAGVGGYTGKLGKDVKPSAVAPSPAVNTATRLNAVVAYKSALFTVGGEYFYAKNWNNVTGSISPTLDIKSDGSKLGSLLISKGNIEWVPANNSVKKRRLSWEKFAQLMETEGKVARMK